MNPVDDIEDGVLPVRPKLRFRMEPSMLAEMVAMSKKGALDTAMLRAMGIIREYGNVEEIWASDDVVSNMNVVRALLRDGSRVDALIKQNAIQMAMSGQRVCTGSTSRTRVARTSSASRRSARERRHDEQRRACFSYVTSARRSLRVWG